MRHLQVESRMEQIIFLYVIPAGIMASWYAMLKFLKIELSGNCFAFRAVMNFLGECYFKFGNVMRIRYLCHNHILELTNPKNQAEVHN